MNTCINAPNIVYQNSWLSQTAAIGPVNIYTVTASGQYRVSASIEVFSNSGTPGGFGPNVQVNIWDSFLGNASSPNNVSATAVGPSSSSGCGIVIPVSVVSTVSIPIYTTITSGSHLDHYNLYVIVEQLQ